MLKGNQEIEITFDENGELLFTDFVARLMKPVKMSPFDVSRRFRRIEVLGLAAAGQPRRRKAPGDLARPGPGRSGAAETVVETSPSFFDDEAAALISLALAPVLKI